jgi:DNA-binding GntR family transcriptional regulator
MDVSALSIPTAMARKLQCRPNSPGLLVVRRYRGANDSGLSNSVSIYPQSRFQVSIRYRLNWAA